MQKEPKTANSRFKFSENIPAEMLQPIQSILIPLDWILPGWVQQCYIIFPAGGSAEGYTCEMNCAYEYRYMTMRIYPAWLNLNEEERKETCIHELLHSMTCILANYARDEIERLLPADEAPKYRAAVLKELTMRHESMTQDLAFMIRNHLGD